MLCHDVEGSFEVWFEAAGGEGINYFLIISRRTWHDDLEREQSIKNFPPEFHNFISIFPLQHSPAHHCP